MKKVRPFLISSIITTLVMVTISLFIENASEARSVLAVGLIAGITIITIPIYDIDRWSLAKRSIVHFLIMLTTVLPLVIYAGWYSNHFVSAGVFLLFGVVGWTVGFLINKYQSKSSN